MQSANEQQWASPVLLALRKAGEMGMRMIDAHDLYDQFLKEMETLVKSTNHKDIDLEAISMLCGAKLITDAPTITPEPGWISVKDRLPPANDLVIVSINDDRGDNDYRYTDAGWYLAEGKCWIVDNEATINVEAWMPLPKPYKPPKEEA